MTLVILSRDQFANPWTNSREGQADFIYQHFIDQANFNLQTKQHGLNCEGAEDVIQNNF